ncbi:hypothetical protein ACWD26_36595 [Streptomyces sp. NPDC002787]
MFAIKVALTVFFAGLLVLGLTALASGRILVPVLGLRTLPRPRWWGAGGAATCSGGLLSLWGSTPMYGPALVLLGVGLTSMARKPYPSPPQSGTPTPSSQGPGAPVA